MTKQLFNFDYNLNVDVLSAVEDFYPGLNDNEVQSIAAEIVRNYDYSMLYDEIHCDLQSAAAICNIDLIDKNVPPIQSHLTAI